MLPTLLTRVRDISEFVFRNPIREQLINHLSEVFCPVGEISGVTVAFINDAGNFAFHYAEGYADNHRIKSIQLKLGDQRPAADAVKGLVTIKASKKELEMNYPKFPIELMEHYEFVIAMPIGTNCMYAFATSSNLSGIQGIEEYLSCIRSLLEFYERTHNDSKSALTMSHPSRAPRSLTERQGVILEKIKCGDTNAMIAHDLGYSESLIRQETIIIYRKLGVAGRKEISPKMQD